MRSEAKVVATVFALSAFAVATVAGLYAGNDASTILLRAILAMIACQVVGLLAGAIIERVLVEHEAKYRSANPVPELRLGADDAPDVDDSVDESENVNSAGA